MTAPDPGPTVVLVATSVTEGCTRCGTQATVQLHPYAGRRCSDDIVLPPGRFRADLAADMVEMHRVDAAFTYLLAWLHAEAGRRFDAALQALTAELSHG